MKGDVGEVMYDGDVRPTRGDEGEYCGEDWYIGDVPPQAGDLRDVSVNSQRSKGTHAGDHPGDCPPPKGDIPPEP
jgi:hypothetical protein